MTDSKDKLWEITIQTTNKECPFVDKFFGHLNTSFILDAVCKHPNVRKGRVVCNQNNCPLVRKNETY